MQYIQNTFLFNFCAGCARFHVISQKYHW